MGGPFQLNSGDSATDLLRERLDEHQSRVGVVEERETKVDGVAAGDVVLIERVAAAEAGEVDDALDVVVLEDLAQLGLVLGRHEDALGPARVRHVGDELLDLRASVGSSTWTADAPQASCSRA